MFRQSKDGAIIPEEDEKEEEEHITLNNCFIIV